MQRVLGLFALALLVACFASSSADAACTANAGTTIASAGTLTVDGCVSGGGNKIDFWKVALTGGDRVQVTVSSAVELDLYPPDTIDLGFITVRPADVEVASPPRGSTQVLTIQAPFSATFVVAACQPVDSAADGGDCRGVFTDPGKYRGRCSRHGHIRRARQRVRVVTAPRRSNDRVGAPAPARLLRVGRRQRRGLLDLGTQRRRPAPDHRPARVSRRRVRSLPPGTTDDTLTQNTPTDSDLATTSEGVASPQVATLTASSAGTYVLAACEPQASATTPASDSARRGREAPRASSCR